MQTDARRSLGRRAALTLALLPFLLGACIEERAHGVTISSDLAEPVEIVYLKDGEMDGGRLEPGTTRIFPFDLYRPGIPDGRSCTTFDIVARSLDGKVVARIPPPRCIDINVDLSDWVVP